MNREPYMFILGGYQDGIESDTELEKIRKQFGIPEVWTPAIQKWYIDKFDEIMKKELTEQEKEKKKEQAKSVKSTTKKPTEAPKKEATKPTTVHKNKSSEEKEDDTLIKISKELLDTLMQHGYDIPQGKHEKKGAVELSPELKKYIEEQSKVSLTDKSTEGEKKMQTITIALTNGKTITWTSDNYDNYKLSDGCFIIMKNGAYVGIYNMKYVTSAVVN